MKGIRELAMGTPDTPTHQSAFDSYTYKPTLPYKSGYLDEDFDYPDTLNNSEKYETKENNYTAEDAILDDIAMLQDGEFQINLIVTMKELGKMADPDEKNFDFDKMLDAAESTGLEKVLSLAPELNKKYTFLTSSIENVDTITVSVFLKPKF